MIKMLSVTEKMDLLSNGCLILTDIPDSESAQAIACCMGTLIPQPPYGCLNYQVEVIPNASSTSSSKGKLSIPPHTDAPYLTCPPKWVVLYCLEESLCGGGVTFVLHCGVLLQNQIFKDFLTTERFIFFNGDTTLDQSCLDENGIFRFSINQMVLSDYAPSENCLEEWKIRCSSSVLLDICQIFNTKAKPFSLRHGDLLIIDNHACLHARSAFLSTNRRLVRFWLGMKIEVYP